MALIETTTYAGTTTTELRARFLARGEVFILDQITSETAADVVQQLVYLDGCEEIEKVKIYINSPGGEVMAGLLIYDILQGMKKTVDIFCIGFAASMAALILAGGKKGRRHILPHSKIMIHEPLIGVPAGGSASSIKHLSESINETKDLVNDLLALHTEKPREEIDEATAFDNYMDASAAVQFGLVDDIVFSLGGK